MVGSLIGPEVPSWLDANVAPALDDLYDWTVRQRPALAVHVDVPEPISDALRGPDAVLAVLRGLRWPGVLALPG